MNNKHLLFSDKFRNKDLDPIRSAETLYKFYDRSTCSGSEMVRENLNSWLPELPSALTEEFLRVPLQKQNNVHDHNERFISLFYEAYIYKILIGSGIGHDEIKYEKEACNGKLPDFFIDRGSDSFYVEATIAGKLSKEDKDLNEIVELINRECSSDIYRLRTYNFNILNSDNKKLNKKDVIKEIKRWLKELDKDLVISENDENIDRCKQKITLNFVGLGLIIRPFIQTGNIPTLIATSPYMATPSTASDIIRNKIENKKRQLKGLNYACILAINTLYDFGANKWDLEGALLGDVKVCFPRDDTDRPSEVFRCPNGVVGPHPDQSKFFSGVILSPGLRLSNFHRKEAHFITSPWARHILKDSNPLMRLKRSSVDSETGEVFDHEGLLVQNLIPNLCKHLYRAHG